MSVWHKRNFCLVFCLSSFWGLGALSAQEIPVEQQRAAEEHADGAVSSDDVSSDDVSSDGTKPDALNEDDSAEERLQMAQSSLERGATERGEQDAAAGWAIFERALDALVNQEEAQARSALEELAAKYPDHRATQVSADALATLNARAKKAEQASSRNLGLNGEEKTNAARAELVTFQTSHGIALGGEFCGATSCNDVRLTTAMLAVGGGAGLGLSLLASRDGVTPGFATLINSGTLWGGYHGAMISAATNSGDNLPGILAVSQLAGIGASALVWSQLHPTVGEVSMANSGGIWLGALAFLGQLAANSESPSDAIIWSILAATDVGIIGGALLSQYEPMTRGRTLIIDSGGVLGMLVGMGAYVLVNPDFNEPTGFALSAMGGGVAGLGTATFLTRDWDAPDDGSITARWGVGATEEGATLSLSGEF